MIATLAVQTGISPRELRELPADDLAAISRVLVRQARALERARHRRGR